MENDKLILEILQGISQHIQGMDERIQGMDERIQGMDKRIQSMDVRLRKVEISIDEIRKDTKILAEGQVAHREQNEREHNEIIQLLNEKTTILEKATVRNSLDIREAKEERDEIFEVLSKRRVASAR